MSYFPISHIPKCLILVLTSPTFFVHTSVRAKYLKGKVARESGKRATGHKHRRQRCAASFRNMIQKKRNELKVRGSQKRHRLVKRPNEYKLGRVANSFNRSAPIGVNKFSQTLVSNASNVVSLQTDGADRSLCRAQPSTMIIKQCLIYATPCPIFGSAILNG